MAENYVSTPAEHYSQTADPYPGLLSDVPDVGGWAAKQGVTLEASKPFWSSSLKAAHEAANRQTTAYEARYKTGVYAEGIVEGEATSFIGGEPHSRRLLLYCISAGGLGLALYSFFTGRKIVA